MIVLCLFWVLIVIVYVFMALGFYKLMQQMTHEHEYPDTWLRQTGMIFCSVFWPFDFLFLLMTIAVALLVIVVITAAQAVQEIVNTVRKPNGP